MKYIHLMVCVLILAACGQQKADNRAVVATVNDYEITIQEFEEKYLSSSYALRDTLESKREFLDHLIRQKLILQEAQNLGLDKQSNFRETIERFWERSLLKLALDHKTRELSSQTGVGEEAIRKIYNEMIHKGITEKTYEEVYPQIKWQATKQKETELMDDWIEGLRATSKIQVYQELLQ